MHLEVTKLVPGGLLVHVREDVLRVRVEYNGKGVAHCNDIYVCFCWCFWGCDVWRQKSGPGMTVGGQVPGSRRCESRNDGSWNLESIVRNSNVAEFGFLRSDLRLCSNGSKSVGSAVVRPETAKIGVENSH